MVEDLAHEILVEAETCSVLAVFLGTIAQKLRVRPGDPQLADQARQARLTLEALRASADRSLRSIEQGRR